MVNDSSKRRSVPSTDAADESLASEKGAHR